MVNTGVYSPNKIYRTDLAKYKDTTPMPCISQVTSGSMDTEASVTINRASIGVGWGLGRGKGIVSV